MRALLWIVGFFGFLASSYFLGWLAKVKTVIAGFNSDVWVFFPLEVQIMFTAAIIVIVVMFLYSVIRG